MSTNHPSETEQVATFFEGYASGFDSIYGHAEKRSGFQKLVDPNNNIRIHSDENANIIGGFR